MEEGVLIMYGERVAQWVEEMSSNRVMKKIYGEIPGRQPQGILRSRWSCCTFD